MFNELTADVLAKKAVRDSPGFKVTKLFFSGKNKLERFHTDKLFLHSQTFGEARGLPYTTY